MRIVLAAVEYADVSVYQDWPAIRTKLEPLIVQYALEERKRLATSRRRAIHDAYKKYQSDFRSSEPNSKDLFCTLPPPSGLAFYEPIKNLLILPSGTGEFEKQVKSCVEDFINAWPHLKVQELVSTYSSLYVPQNVFDTSSLKNLNIFVVASIFLCIPCTRARRADSTFFGWAAAVRHKNACRCRSIPPPCEDNFAISVEGHEAALTLIGNLGLDPRNTFPRDLDRLKLRFLCMNCEERLDVEEPIFGWRGMVLSFFFNLVSTFCLHPP